MIRNAVVGRQQNNRINHTWRAVRKPPGLSICVVAF